MSDKSKKNQRSLFKSIQHQQVSICYNTDKVFSDLLLRGILLKYIKSIKKIKIESKYMDICRDG